MTERMLGLFLLLMVPTAAGAQVRTDAPGISPGAVLYRMGVLADDSMAGRDTPSPELEQAARWIAGELERFGLRGALDSGEFVQRYPLVRRRPAPEASALRIDGGPSLRFGTDAVWLGGGLPSGLVQGRALVIEPGSGIMPGPAEIRGSIIVLRARTSAAQTLLPQLQVFLVEVGRLRPAAIIVAADVADSVWTRYQQRQSRVHLAPPWQDTEVSPIVLARTAPLASVATGTVIDLDLATEVIERTDAPNVVAVSEGTDPELRHEHLVFVAHMDHVGVAGPSGACPARGNNTICNGADDNASGTAAVMSIAEVMVQSELRPRRSVLFLFVSGEEYGLWGSDWFAEYPPVPLDNVVAVINADNVARNDPATLFAIGVEHSDLGATVRRVHERHPELGFTRLLDLPPGQESYYFRSDHYNFSRRGVPALFFSTGVHADYHQPTDEVALVDPDKTARIATLMMHVGLDIANAPGRPQWNAASRRQIVDR